MSSRYGRFGSLRVRITLAMLLLAAVGSSIFALSVYLAAERLEQSVLNRHVRAEFDTLVEQTRADPTLKTVRSALLLGFVGRDNPALPAEIGALANGVDHAVGVGDRAYQVYVGDDAGRKLYVAYDITQWEALERPVLYVLVTGVVFGCLLAIALGFWTSAQVIAPVTALSKRLQGIDPKERKVRIAPEFDGGEVSAIAESFDRYMERLDGFVEREQLFTSAAAHELRTPVAVIQGATEVLAEQKDLPPAARRATARLERGTRDIREFIDALLMLSRETPREAVAEASSELAAIVQHVVDDHRPAAEAKALELCVRPLGRLRLDVPPALPAIVISNLLRNAIEHTESGRIEIGLEGPTLTIADTGSGISDRDRASLFERDYSTKPGGGMGLHLTKRICDRFGWALAIASAVGAGTTVRVTFAPLANALV